MEEGTLHRQSVCLKKNNNKCFLFYKVNVHFEKKRWSTKVSLLWKHWAFLSQTNHFWLNVWFILIKTALFLLPCLLHYYYYHQKIISFLNRFSLRYVLWLTYQFCANESTHTVNWQKKLNFQIQSNHWWLVFLFFVVIFNTSDWFSSWKDHNVKQLVTAPVKKTKVIYFSVPFA